MKIQSVAFISIVFLFAGIYSCTKGISNVEEHNENLQIIEEFQFPEDTLIQLTELRPGDILVKPNMNWFPGTAMVNGGKGFGHVALVIKGGKDTNTMRLLEKIEIFESQARDVPEEFELRTAKGYLEGADFRFANVTFGLENAGFRYRLRFPMTSAQCDSIIQFVLSQDSDKSCWRAQKTLPEILEGNQKPAFQDKKIWYCSLLIWQAFYEVLGIDLDPNGGIMVYPNDVISSSNFRNDSIDHQKRVRF
jgi:hypothetical protein